MDNTTLGNSSSFDDIDFAEVFEGRRYARARYEAVVRQERREQQAERRLSQEGTTRLEDPCSSNSDLQGFMDDDDPFESLVALGSSPDYSVFNTTFLLRTIFSAALVGIFLGIGIAGSQQGLDKSNKNNTAPSTLTSIRLPPFPPQLEIDCSELNLEKKESYDSCLELCEPAKCCHFIPNNTMSCLTEQRHECELYRASCQHLHHKRARDAVNHKTKEQSVNQVCSTQSLSTRQGVDACKQLCQPFACCFQGDNKKQTSCGISQAQCSDHGACATVHLVGQDGHLASHEQAQETIATACQDLSTSGGQQRCTNVCNPAICCFLSPNAWNKPCNVTCSHYEACSKLYGPVQTNTNDNNGQQEIAKEVSFSIPHQLEKTCSPSQLSTLEGARKCLDLCQHHLCCFADKENGGCLTQHPHECQLYSACRQLTERGSSLEKKTTNSPQQEQREQQQRRDACSRTHVNTHGPQACIEACSDNLCCLVDPRFEASCFRDAICHKKFAPCRILAPQNVPPLEDPALIQKVKQVCTTSNLKSNLGVTECENDCSQRQCCIESGAGNCKHTDKFYCHQVKSCQLLLDQREQKEKQEGTANDKNLPAGPTDITKQLELTCHADNIATLSGFHYCYDHCYYHLCCFASLFREEDQSAQCRHSNQPNAPECTEFAPCSNLLEPVIHKHNNSKNTSNAHNTMNLQSEVTLACSRNSVTTARGLKACRQACASRLCCFQDPNLPSSCIGIHGKDECEKYDACAILVSDSSHSVYVANHDPYLVHSVKKLCSVEHINKKNDNDDDNESGAHQCRRQCEKRACCFASGAKSCYETNKEWCNQIKQCTILPDLVMGK